MTSAEENLTLLLKRIHDGDETAREELFEQTYDQLRAIAHRLMQGERQGHTLHPTALVHEVYSTLLGMVDDCPPDHHYFFAAAARAMRRVLVDYARKRNAQKRGSRWQRVPLDDIVDRLETAAQADLSSLHRAMGQLESNWPIQFEALERKLFGGQTTREIADAMGVSVSKVDKYLRFARALVKKQLDEERANEPTC